MKPYNRTVKIKPGEVVLIVNGDQEIVVVVVDGGLEVRDARGFDLRHKQRLGDTSPRRRAVFLPS